MLVLSRKLGQSIVIGDNIVVSIVELRGDQIRLGIEAPRDVPINRLEVLERSKAETASEIPPEPRVEHSPTVESLAPFDTDGPDVLAAVADHLQTNLAPQRAPRVVT